MQIKVFFTGMVSNLDSVWNRGTRELGNGLLKCKTFFERLGTRASHSQVISDWWNANNPFLFYTNQNSNIYRKTSVIQALFIPMAKCSFLLWNLKQTFLADKFVVKTLAVSLNCKIQNKKIPLPTWTMGLRCTAVIDDLRSWKSVKDKR